MTKILIATGNQGKAHEMLEVLSVLPFDFVTLADLGLKNDVVEDGDTHEANALIKAHYFFEKTKLPTIGEDSGIHVDALANELGIHTRRWGAGKDADDNEWLDYFLRRLEQEENREAKFFCAAAFVCHDFEFQMPNFDAIIKKIFIGETKGYLKRKPQCEIPRGIPISAVFVPKGASKVYAQLSAQEKNEISHRGKAMKQLKDYLISFFSS